jgi:hypothetical protein
MVNGYENDHVWWRISAQQNFHKKFHYDESLAGDQKTIEAFKNICDSLHYAIVPEVFYESYRQELSNYQVLGRSWQLRKSLMRGGVQMRSGCCWRCSRANSRAASKSDQIYLLLKEKNMSWSNTARWQAVKAQP